MNQETKKCLILNPAIPYDPEVANYFTGRPGPNSGAHPFEFTGWRNETMAWKETAYLGAALNPQPTFKVSGPEARKFLSAYCTNNFDKFEVGTSKHGIMCNERGQIMEDGLLICTGEDEYVTFEMTPYIDYALGKSGYNAIGEDLTGKMFLYQIGGPKSLEVVEQAAQEDLHDIGFLRHRMSKINGKDVRVVRIGMAGTLAYEVHGKIEDAHAVYNTLWNAGEPLGLRKLGQLAYMMNHTENGFPQGFYHFIFAWATDRDFAGYLQKLGIGVGAEYLGSLGTDDIELRYRNPIELGWSRSVKFDHEFVGRKALEGLAANPARKTVTLVWNKEDILDIYASRFEPGEPYADLDRPNDFIYGGRLYNIADKVLNDKGEFIGISSGRAMSCYYHRMISLCTIDMAYGELDREVFILRGDPGTRQKKIRARVSRFPYLDLPRNDNFDVGAIPSLSRGS